MSNKSAGSRAVARLQEVVASVEAIAEREEDIAVNLRRMASSGELRPEYVHRARARADTLMRLAADLRKAVGLPAGERW